MATDFVKFLESARRKKGKGQNPKVFVFNIMSPSEQARMGAGAYGAPFNTGAGPDGVVQPSRPAMLDTATTPPSVYHEGETVVPFQGGKRIIPAHTAAQQEGLAELQAKHNLPGYQEGGFVLHGPGMDTADKKTYDIGQQSAPTRTATAAPVVGSMPNTPTVDLSYRSASTGQAPAPSGGTQTPMTKTATANKVAGPRPLQHSVTFDANNNVTGGSVVPAGQGTTPAAAPPPPAANTYDIAPGSNYENDARAAYQDIRGVARGDDPRTRRLANQALTDFDVRANLSRTRAVQDQSSDPYLTDNAKRATQAGLERDINIARAGLSGDLADQAFERMDRATRDVYDLGREQTRYADQRADVARDQAWEDFYNAAEYGDDATVRAAYEKAFGRPMDPNASVNDIRDYARKKREQDIALGDVKLERWEENKKRYGDSQQWQAYQQAVAAGDYNTAAGLYQELTGKQLDTGQWEFDQGMVNRETTARVEAIESRLGDQQFESVLARIDAGLPYSEEVFGQYGISKQEYDEMRLYSAAGETDITRKVNAANVLLSMPGAENKEKAGELLNEAFPWMVDKDGNGIDMSQMVRDERMQYVTTAMGEIADYISSTGGMKSWDEFKAENQSTINNWMESSGMDESQIAMMYSSMNTSSIDKAWNDIQKSDLYKGLNPADQELWKEVFTGAMNGSLYLKFEETGQYEVRTADGSYVTKFGSQEEADRFVANNPDLGYKVVPEAAVVPKNALQDGPEKKTAPVDEYPITVRWSDGTSDVFKTRAEAQRFAETNNKTITSIEGEDAPTTIADARNAVEVGKAFMHDGKMYRKTGSGTEEEVMFDAGALKSDSEYAWDTDADLVMTMGPDNPYYQDVVSARAEDVLTGEKPRTALGGAGDPVYEEVWSKAQRGWKPTAGWDGSSRRDFSTPPPPTGSYFLWGSSLAYKASDGRWSDGKGRKNAVREFTAYVFDEKQGRWVEKTIKAGSI